MVDIEHEAGRQAVKRQMEAAKQAGENSLGIGTAGFTIANAAYRGTEVAASEGAAPPADPGFSLTGGLGYVDEKGPKYNDFPPTNERGTMTGGFRPENTGGQ